MTNNYKIMRVTDTKYWVVLGENVVHECTSFEEAQNFIMVKNTEELLAA